MASKFALTNATLVDGTGRPPRKGMTVVVEGDDIVAVTAELPSVGTHQIDLGNRTLLPGLIDAHIHLSSLPRVAPEQRSSAVTEQAGKLLASGTTAARDLGAYDDVLFRLRDAIATGASRGPRLVLCGQVISARCPGALAFPGMYRQVNGPIEVRDAVREQARAGADVIKLMVTGALTVADEDIDPPQLSQGELAAAVDEAHRLQLPVAAHAEGAAGIQLAIAGHVDTIEHAEMAYTVDGGLDAMADKGIVLVPTLSLFDWVAQSSDIPAWMRERAKRLGEAAQRTVEAARAAGVAIAVGGDTPEPNQAARELVALTGAGLTPLEAVTAATATAARAARLDNERGTIEPGKRADLLVVDGDPLVDPTVLTQPNNLWLILHNGRAVAQRAQDPVLPELKP